MNNPQEIPPQARRIFFTGALQAVDRQIKHLEAERSRIALELDQARQECEDLIRKGGTNDER